MMGWDCDGDVAMNGSCILPMGWEGDYIYALCTHILYMHLCGICVNYVIKVSLVHRSFLS